MKIGMLFYREPAFARAERVKQRGFPEAHCEDSPDSYFAERSGEDFDLADYLRRFMEDVPTLQRANVVLNGPKDRYRLATIVDGKLHIEERH